MEEDYDCIASVIKGSRSCSSATRSNSHTNNSSSMQLSSPDSMNSKTSKKNFLSVLTVDDYYFTDFNTAAAATASLDYKTKIKICKARGLQYFHDWSI